MSLTAHRNLKILIVACALVLGVVASATQVKLGATGEPESAPPGAPTGTPTGPFPVTISAPAGPPRVDTGRVDADGNAVTASCTTCHATRAPNPDNERAEDMDEFHQGLTYVHGGLACLSCHDAGNYDALRLASGKSLPYPRVMTLCSQCHGPQARDYARGAHGGMTGYWDLSRGPRERNNCVDCHDPHAPAFPRMMPTFKPRDRFLTGPKPAREDH